MISKFFKGLKPFHLLPRKEVLMPDPVRDDGAITYPPPADQPAADAPPDPNAELKKMALDLARTQNRQLLQAYLQHRRSLR